MTIGDPYPSRGSVRRSAVSLRPATPHDAQQLYAWRMDPETRQQSFSQSEIRPETHAAWLTATLADPQQRLYIAESGSSGIGIGMGRLDWRSGRCEISYALAPDCRGLKRGASLICALHHAAFRLGQPAPMARVKAGNIASLRALERAGYCIRDTIIEMEYAARG